MRRVPTIALALAALAACGDDDRALAPPDAGAGRVNRQCEYNEATGMFDRNCVYSPPGGWDGGPSPGEAWCTRPVDGGVRECTFYSGTPYDEPDVCIYCSGRPVDPQTGLERCLRAPCGLADGGPRR